MRGVEACRHPEQCQHDHSVQVKKNRVKRAYILVHVGQEGLITTIFIAGFPIHDLFFCLIFLIP